MRRVTPRPGIRALLGIALLAGLLLAACEDAAPDEPAGSGAALAPAAATGGSGASSAFTLRAEVRDGATVYVGVGGGIDEVVDPPLRVPEGALVQVTLINGDAEEHDINFPDFQASSESLMATGSQTTLTFVANKPGEFPYYCTLPGHRETGMAGRLIVAGSSAAPPTAAMSDGMTPTAPPHDGMSAVVPAQGADIARDPADLPPPLSVRPPQTVHLDLEAMELTGQLADGTTFPYMTFNGKVPGPFLRVRVGDTVVVSLKNRADSRMKHSIDLHAVSGPDGGAGVMQVPPGHQQSFTFKALHAGLFVYHCATPMVAEHIASGMYGLILVEPPGGLPPVDREFYVMQGEIYTAQPFGTPGAQAISVPKLLAEQPEYFVFNGAVGALTNAHPLHAQVGQTVRIFFGNGGPNFVSSFHVIGAVFDRVYELGALQNPPLRDVQSALAPPGGATAVELTLPVPGRYMLVDHALARTERGLDGFLQVDGQDNPALFHAGEP